ncbi:MAG: TolC family protein [Pseudomonadota bacterium]|nr:TolC family protein [Pseudomonadota bacterium]
MKPPFFQIYRRTVLVCSLLASLTVHAQILSLDEAVSLAREQDAWLQGSRHAQRAMEDMSVASGTLPDPKVSLAFANLPTNTWDFDQEPMTQFKVGISQMFPRGEQRALKRKQLQLRSQVMPFERQERAAQIQQQVSHLWLETWKSQATIELIERNRYLFEQMSAITQSSYSSALGRTRQQDLIRAQLELTRIDDRLAQLQQQRDTGLASLGQWLGQVEEMQLEEMQVRRPQLQLPSSGPETRPQIALVAPTSLLENDVDWQALTPYFLQHPSVRMLEQQIVATATDVDLARQKYQPEWGLNASYGYREDDPMGNPRADFFSVGVSFDLPVFTGNRQDREVSAAVAKVESIKTQKWLRLKALLAEFEAARAQWLRLGQRHRLYQDTLLPQIHEQAEAALTAYTNDNGDFAEVMRARIAELNGEIDALAIAVQQQQTVAQLNYLFTAVDSEYDSAQGETEHE